LTRARAAQGLGRGFVESRARAAADLEPSSGAAENELRANQTAGTQDQDLRGHRARSSPGGGGIEAFGFSWQRRAWTLNNSSRTLHEGLPSRADMG